jgi:hypothetical protein
MEEYHARISAVERWRTLTREQKLSVGVLAVCGIIALVMSVIRVRSLIIRPFTTPVQLLVELRKQYGPTEEELVAQSKKTDTDGDGISDYDETNVYHTSPYLKDSDSDGVPDNIEIARGTDPNCPEGKKCLSTTTGTEVPTGTSSTLEPPTPIGTYGPTSLPTRDPKVIRQYLKASGVTDIELQSYSDQNLLDAYDQSQNQYGGAATSTDTQASATTTGQ